MRHTVLFEVGLEELPARLINDLESQLKQKTTDWLIKERIDFEKINIFSTPRRLAVQIEKISTYQKTIEVEAKGPTEKIALNEATEWTKAAIGFAKGQGKTIEDLYTKEIKGTSYVFVKKRIEGESVEALLSEFKTIVESLQLGKSMKWGSETMRFIRPIRWLVALYDKKIIPFEIAHVETGRKTYGHRFLGKAIDLDNADQYEESLKEQYVICNRIKRQDLIKEQISKLTINTSYDAIVDQELLDEVTNLVEFPQAFIGSFDEKYLKLPAEVLITSMKSHQRYFPVKSTNHTLLAYFIGVRNGTNDYIESVRKGNEKVLHARLQDAQFFYEEDEKHSISSFNKKLNRVIFQQNLGTYEDKVERVKKIAEQIATLCKLDSNSILLVKRASEIYKFDLMTNMVNEFTELQGVMGEKYALHFGENPLVAQAIKEHYMPVSAYGELPETEVGKVLAIADKLDTIVGCISVGLVPSGSQDPYGLRRQASGILRMLLEIDEEITIESLIKLTRKELESVIKKEDVEKNTNDLNSFFQLRASFILKERNIESDIIQAVTNSSIGVFQYTVDKAVILKAKRSDQNFKKIEEAFVRVLNVTKDKDVGELKLELLESDSEKYLKEVSDRILENFYEENNLRKARNALETLGELAPAIHNFFEHNMVMSDNEAIKQNRLSLLSNISQAIKTYADLTKIEWKQHF